MQKISINSQLKIYESIEDEYRKNNLYSYLVSRGVEGLKEPKQMDSLYKYYDKKNNFLDISGCSKFYKLDFYNSFDMSSRNLTISNSDFTTQIAEEEILSKIEPYFSDENQTYIEINGIKFFISNLTLYDSKITYIIFVGYCY